MQSIFPGRETQRKESEKAQKDVNQDPRHAVRDRHHHIVALCHLLLQRGRMDLSGLHLLRTRQPFHKRSG